MCWRENVCRHMSFHPPECVCMCTDWQQSRGKSSRYLRPVRRVVIIFTLTELMCLGPMRRIRAIRLVRTYTHTPTQVHTPQQITSTPVRLFTVYRRNFTWRNKERRAQAPPGVPLTPPTIFLRSFSPALELSSCMLKNARMPRSLGCK